MQNKCIKTWAIFNIPKEYWNIPLHSFLGLFYHTLKIQSLLYYTTITTYYTTEVENHLKVKADTSPTKKSILILLRVALTPLKDTTKEIDISKKPKPQEIFC